MDDFLDNLLDDDKYDIYDDSFDDQKDQEEAFEDEINDLTMKLEKVQNNAKATRPTKRDIVEDSRNLLVDSTLERVLEELKFADLPYVTAPELFINTLDGYISGIEFNESTHMNSVEPTQTVPIIKSNYGHKKHVNYMVPSKLKKSNRGRNKKKTEEEENRSLKSQITMFVRRPEIERSSEITKHKFFRGGRIQISGLTYRDIQSAKIMVNNIIELVSDTDMVKKDVNGDPEEVALKSLSSTMENYKYQVIIEQYESIDLSRFKEEIFKNAYLLESVNNTGDEITLAYVKYDGSLAAMSLVLSIPNIKKKKKVLTTNVFSSGRINTLGCRETKYVHVVARFLNVVMEKAGTSIIVFNRDCNWSNYLILPKRMPVDGNELFIDPVDYVDNIE